MSGECTHRVGILGLGHCGAPAVVCCTRCRSWVCANHAVQGSSLEGLNLDGKVICRDCARTLSDRTPVDPESALRWQWGGGYRTHFWAGAVVGVVALDAFGDEGIETEEAYLEAGGAEIDDRLEPGAFQDS